eukprot:CAMPEP_0119564384 /NCGR_PEP_ID=MMETSP1352-20130426/26808_1 /TAXON_ID=265584 /ORGANISM="Stauroneis constricta, Strain CCMP1120" /LENGTH=208 /DNA_ID=CAMNT_0007613139 /DNA_START=36 /DNA_END=658 /DNA_ORIENTATION=-
MTKSSTANDPTFRSAPRKSNLRANLFLAECIGVTWAYLRALYHRGDEEGGGIWHGKRSSTAILQIHLMAAFAVIYMVRLNAMSRWLLPRELSVEEITFVILVWLPSIMGSYAMLRADDVSAFTLLVATALYAVGSYLNSYSELQRMWWKANPANKGRCYTLGLFSASRNVNYFGDTVLFAGWAIATGSVWNVWVPLVMGSMFWFHHIP